MLTTTITAWVTIISLIQLTQQQHAFSFSPSLSSSSTSFPTALLRRQHQRRSSSGSNIVTTLAKSASSRHNQIHSIKRQQQWRIGAIIGPHYSSALSATSNNSVDEPSGNSSTSTTTTSSTAAINDNVNNNGNEEEHLIAKLQQENQSLQEELKSLQIQNEQLLSRGKQSPDAAVVPYEQRLILEDFEGEGKPALDARGGVVDGWNTRERRYTEPWDEDNKNDDDEQLALSSSPSSLSSFSSQGEDEVCEYDTNQNKWISPAGECPVDGPDVTFLDAMKSRAAWLVGLLAMQSCSGFILSRNELLLQDHPVIIYFLTMLVGAGGNAGNQASVRVIRGLALGTLNPETQNRFLSREIRMAFALSAILSVAGFFRAVAFQTPLPETLAVTTALSMIVFSSICLGAVLPLLLQKAGVDPAHSSTTIQVVMDILGVLLTVFVSTLVLDSGWGKTMISTLGSKLGL